MAVRDRVALWALTGGVLVAIVAWRLAGPWAAMVIGIVAVLVACAAYRVQAPRIDLDRLPLDAEAQPEPARAASEQDQ